MDRKEFFTELWKRLSTKLVWIALLVVLYIVVKIVLEMTSGFNSTTIDWSAMGGTIASIAGIILSLAILYLIIEYVRGLAYRLYLKLPGSVKFTLRVAGRTFEIITMVASGALLYHFWIQEPSKTFSAFVIILVLTVKDSIRKEKQTINAPTHTPPQT